MLQSEDVLNAKIDELLGHSISGHAIILLDHCESQLLQYLRRDSRIDRRILLLDGEPSALPYIQFSSGEQSAANSEVLDEIGGLLHKLERLTDSEIQDNPYLVVKTRFLTKSFEKSVYPVTKADSTYQLLCRLYSDIAGATEESYGTDAEWNDLFQRMKGRSSFSQLICDEYGATTNLSVHMGDVWESGDTTQKWLLWLALKSFGEKSHPYLSYVIENSNNYTDFESHIYLDLADVKIDDPLFAKMYKGRKNLIEKLPENLPLIDQYCTKLGVHEKNAVYYLTDGSEAERYEFMRLMSVYEYTEDEIQNAVKMFSQQLSLYMSEFVFDPVNTRVSENDTNLRSVLTTYFNEYKRQKLTNRIFPEFLSKVNEFAVSRPYNKLPLRSSIISHMDRKGMELFFFDALGVEYLSFILAKCEQYGMVSELSIGHCELPSITLKNKEFENYFDESLRHKIDTIDEMKHHSQVFQYQKCPYPIHLLAELEAIDTELRKIKSLLVQDSIETALIVADHGASRLAVLYGHEDEPPIPLSESGKHSGRCCEIEEDPHLPNTAYQDGYAVIANYDRFKGGRKANVEVHGGATLEEVLVPIIALSKKPESIEICFVDPVIILRPRVVPTLTIYSNIPLKCPRLFFNNEFVDGEFKGDQKHAEFKFPQIKRKGVYTVDVYDGQKNLSIKLEFKVQKQTFEVDLF